MNITIKEFMDRGMSQAEAEEEFKEIADLISDAEIDGLDVITDILLEHDLELDFVMDFLDYV